MACTWSLLKRISLVALWALGCSAAAEAAGFGHFLGVTF